MKHIFLLAVLAVGASAQSLLNSPSSYFGGTDNIVYRTWAESRASIYASSIFLPSNADPEAGAAIHWNIDGDTLSLAVAARATGWLGFGISENGGMQGADMVLFAANKPDELVDSYVLEERLPLTDCQSSWNLVSSQTNDGFLIFEATRLLDTGDAQDRAIIDDSNQAVPATRIIAAWGDSPQVSYHGNNRVRGAVRWFGDKDEQAAFEQRMLANAEGSFVVRASNYPVKSNDTEYASFCVSKDDILAQDVPDVDNLMIIGYEPIVDEDSKAFVHHFTITGSRDSNNALIGDCEDGFENAFELVYVWAPGEGPFALPDNLGAPYGGVGGFGSFQMETHYNNPELVQGILDSSGVRFYYTTQPREFEMGVLQLGDPDVDLFGQQVGNGISSHSFGCPGACSSFAVQQPVTVLREYLHMHRSGTRAVNQQIRNGQVVRSGSIDFFNFDQQGNQAVVQAPFEVEPGDSFNTVCYYQSDGNKVFGLSSQEEMCIAFLYYFPRKLLFDEFPWACGLDMGLDSCEPEYTPRQLSAVADLERGFGTASTECTSGGFSVASSKASAVAVGTLFLGFLM